MIFLYFYSRKAIQEGMTKYQEYEKVEKMLQDMGLEAPRDSPADMHQHFRGSGPETQENAKEAIVMEYATLELMSKLVFCVCDYIYMLVTRKIHKRLLKRKFS